MTNDDLIRPGEEAIEPGRCPHGVVIRIYAVEDAPRLLVEQNLRPDDDIESAAAEAFLLSGAQSVCLVAYDGDSGERMPPEVWLVER